MPLPPLPVRGGGRDVAAIRQAPPLPGLSGLPVSSGPVSSAQTAHTVSPKMDPLQDLKLTAIVGGAVSMAVVQTAHPIPVVLHVGDDLEGMRVIAINEHGIELERGGNEWTLPLQSATDSSATGAVSVTSVAAPEEKIDGTQ